LSCGFLVFETDDDGVEDSDVLGKPLAVFVGNACVVEL
jgi:hypothetical protein